MSDEPRQGISFEGYTDQDVPLRSYGMVMALFNAIFAAALILARASGRSIPERVRLSDILLFGVATHKLSWMIARDAVTSPLRAPFTRLQKVESPTHVEEEPRGTGLQRSVGELVTCQFCVGQWVAAAFALGSLFFPAVTRLVAAVFAILTLSDHLHQTYQALVKRA